MIHPYRGLRFTPLLTGTAYKAVLKDSTVQEKYLPLHPSRATVVKALSLLQQWSSL